MGKTTQNDRNKEEPPAPSPNCAALKKRKSEVSKDASMSENDPVVVEESKEEVAVVEKSKDDWPIAMTMEEL